MDSVKRAIWGDGTQPNETGGQEPVSGQTGNTAAGEPYDAGNLSGKWFLLPNLILVYPLERSSSLPIPTQTLNGANSS